MMMREGHTDRFIMRELLAGADTPRHGAELLGSEASTNADRWGRLCANAGVGRSFIRTSLIVTVAVFVLLLVAGRPFVGLAGASVAGLIAHIRIKRLVAKRRAALDTDLPALLTSLSASVRAGIEPISAISKAKAFFSQKSILFGEIEHFERLLASGLSEEEAISRFCDSVDHPDLPLFRSCVLLSKRHGSALAEPLHRVVRVTRQRQSFRRKTRAALAMHRMSAIGITLCALLIGALQIAMNWQGVSTTMQHPMGSKLIGFGVALIATGTGWMMAMGRPPEE